ncbi:hypothetical protein FQR65_LT04477 [Abscondita terminalis]|nr:hypothetical protein FQR65_LT04477 [Abscondita terminalis]
MDKNTTKSFELSDNLELSNISIPDIPKNIIFPDDLNKYLRDRVQFLTHENGMLYKNISDLDDELEKVRSPPHNSTNGAENFACTKIVELSKQLRERNSEIEAFKTKYAKLQRRVSEMEKCKNREEEEISDSVPEKPRNEVDEQLKLLTEKLSTANGKLCELRNANSSLKSNLKLANKLLQQEVGESFESLQLTINSNGNWRGRSQIICDLQQKNAELREKLKTLEEKEKPTTNNAESTNFRKWDKRMTTLTQENEELRNNVQDLKRKLDASRARNKVTESENIALRSRVSTYTEQNDRDHEMISSLTAKVAHAQETQNEAIREKQIVIQELEQINKNLQLEIAKQMCKINNLTAQTEDQARELNKQRSKTTQQTLKSTNQVNTQYLEAETLRLLELTKLTNEKLDLERNAHSETHLKYLAERQKAAKLEAKVARLELDKNTDAQSVYSLKSSSSLSNMSEGKLLLAEETIKALQTRLDIERQDHKNDINEFTKILSNYNFNSNRN